MKNSPAIRDASELILEGMVATTNLDGSTNVSPMGPVVDRTMARIRLRPFKTSTTYTNLKRSRTGVFHVTDDVESLALAVTGRASEIQLCSVDGHPVLKDSCRWYAFDVEALDESKDRVEIECLVNRCESIRPFLGWNRAMHAVLEAAILATRINILSSEEIHSDLSRLNVIVNKCASEKEKRAMQMILDFVEAT